MALHIATTILFSLLLLSTSILTTTSSPMESSWALSLAELDSENILEGSSLLSCNGKVGGCDGDTYDDVGMDFDAAVRRGLAFRKRYISYEALSKNRVPCNRRGQSYYNCQRGRQANPYRRGCSFITKCARIMN